MKNRRSLKWQLRESMQIFGCSFLNHLLAIILYMTYVLSKKMYKIMKEVKKHIQNEYIRNAFIHPNRKDVRIADIPKLCGIAIKSIY